MNKQKQKYRISQILVVMLILLSGSETGFAETRVQKEPIRIETKLITENDNDTLLFSLFIKNNSDYYLNNAQANITLDSRFIWKELKTEQLKPFFEIEDTYLTLKKIILAPHEIKKIQWEVGIKMEDGSPIEEPFRVYGELEIPLTKGKKTILLDPFFIKIGEKEASRQTEFAFLSGVNVIPEPQERKISFFSMMTSILSVFRTSDDIEKKREIAIEQRKIQKDSAPEVADEVIAAPFEQETPEIFKPLNWFEYQDNEKFVEIGDRLSYELMIQNTGLVSAKKINIETLIPAGTKYIQGTLELKIKNAESEKDEKRNTSEDLQEKNINIGLNILKPGEIMEITYQVQVTEEMETIEHRASIKESNLVVAETMPLTNKMLIKSQSPPAPVNTQCYSKQYISDIIEEIAKLEETEQRNKAEIDLKTIFPSDESGIIFFINHRSDENVEEYLTQSLLSRKCNMITTSTAETLAPLPVPEPVLETEITPAPGEEIPAIIEPVQEVPVIIQTPAFEPVPVPEPDKEPEAGESASSATEPESAQPKPVDVSTSATAQIVTPSETPPPSTPAPENSEIVTPITPSSPEASPEPIQAPPPAETPAPSAPVEVPPIPAPESTPAPIPAPPTPEETPNNP